MGVISHILKSFINNKNKFIFVILFLTLILSFWWIWTQEMHFKDLPLSPDEAETLIGWELGRQLRVLVIVLSSAIALITFTKPPTLKGSTFVAVAVLTVLNLFSLSRFVQGLQFVMHYEQYVYDNIKAQIYSKWEVVYSNFFFESGKLNILGWICVIFCLTLVMLIWFFILKSVTIENRD